MAEVCKWTVRANPFGRFVDKVKKKKKKIVFTHSCWEI